jgi:acid phosphatase (class A)
MLLRRSAADAGFSTYTAVAKLHSDPVFCAELEAAKAEYTDAVAKGLTPSRNCEEEADALAKW